MGRLIGLLALLNGLVLIAGLSMEQVRGKPGVLIDFNADKVRLLGLAERQVTTPAVAVDTVTPEEEVTAPIALATAVAVPNPRCLTWPGLDDGLLSEIEARLQGAGIVAARYDIHLDKRLGWWVYLPPFAEAEAMQAAIDEVRQKGVNDFAPVRGGEMKNAVSLGAFPTQAKAQAQFERLRKLGVQGLRMGPRPKSGSARLSIAGTVPEAQLVGLGEGWSKRRAPVACAGN
ncbi:MAG: SPOR domain-containing protein [Gammaproteobacteria bacterium]|nr:SPOR domain-containing protein [Gammaproteobacteria bacterium]